MSGAELLYLPAWHQLQKQEHDKHHALVGQNRPLAAPIFLPCAPACILVNSGYQHLQMPMRRSIRENKWPAGDIADVFSGSRIAYGHTGGTIDAFVSIGSALSNQFVRTLDGHAETLERVRRPAFGSLLTEFDPFNMSIVSYIEGQRVLEPFRAIINERNRKQIPIFKPELDSGILNDDVLVIKVLRSRSGAVSMVWIEGLGPAGTVYGFRLLLESRPILLELATYASKWDSFEAMIVVKNVEVKKDRLGRKSMVANGPLRVVGCWPIDGTEVDGDVLKTAYATSARVVPEQNNIRYFPAIQEVPLALHLEDYYNRGNKKAAVVPLPRKDYVRGKEFVPSQEFRKLKGDFKEKTRGLSSDKKSEVLKLVFSVARDIIEAQGVEGMTSEEFYIQRAQDVLKREGVLFEGQPKWKEPLIAPDLSEVPLWQGREKDGMPLEFVKNHYGRWLSAFGAEEDRVFQDQIRSRDPKLLQAIHYQLRKEVEKDGRKRMLHDVVKTRSARVDRELENMSVEDVNEKRRLATIRYLRKKRAAESRTAVTSSPAKNNK